MQSPSRGGRSQEQGVDAIVQIETAHANIRLHAVPGKRLFSVLAGEGIPLSSIWTYTRDSDGKPHFVSVTERIHSGQQIYGRVSRNIDIRPFLNSLEPRIRVVSEPVTEWLFPSEEEGAFAPVLAQMTQAECLSFVRRSVADVFASRPELASEPLVVGVSGGGDSNCLLSVICECVPRENVIPVMMLGIPDWDSQRQQAEALCRDLGLGLTIVQTTQVAEFCGIRSVDELRLRFAEEYPDVDREFLGTWMLRRVLCGYARTHGSSYVCIGANREDLVGECLARIANAKLPLPAPFRCIGGVTLVYPMWKVPKKIGDAVHISYSLRNYEARTPSFNVGRSLYYFLAYALADVAPGLDLTLLQAFSVIAGLNPEPFVKDESLDDFICRDAASQQEVNRWAQLLAGLRPNPEVLPEEPRPPD